MPGGIGRGRWLGPGLALSPGLGPGGEETGPSTPPYLQTSAAASSPDCTCHHPRRTWSRSMNSVTWRAGQGSGGVMGPKHRPVWTDQNTYSVHARDCASKGGSSGSPRTHPQTHPPTEPGNPTHVTHPLDGEIICASGRGVIQTLPLVPSSASNRSSACRTRGPRRDHTHRSNTPLGRSGVKR